MSVAAWMLVALHALQLAFTLLPLSKAPVWWVRSLDFPRLQLAVFASILLAVDLIAARFIGPLAWFLVAIAAGSLLYHGTWILPYTPLYPKAVKDADPGADPSARIRILIVNVLMTNRRSERLIEQLRACDPDLWIASEPDRWWQQQLDVCEADYPYTVKCPLDNCYGMLLYSRLELSDVAIQYLVDEDVPSIHALVRLRSGDVVRLHAVHPRPPIPQEDPESTSRDAELVIVGRSVVDSEHPVIVAGDLNDVAWSATTKLFLRISHLLDPRVGRGMFNSFHAEHRVLRWPLDHLFHSKHFCLVELRRLAPFGSDHFPILVELALEPRASLENEEPRPSAQDHEVADEKANARAARPEDVHEPGE